MKSLVPLVAVLLTFSFIACKKDIGNCEPVNPVCSDTVPTGQLCQAVFTRWFYDKTTKSCKQVTYSGCSAKGFTTQEECEACKCK